MNVALASLLVAEMLVFAAAATGRIATAWWIVVDGGAHQLALYTGVCAAIAILAFPLLGPLSDRRRKQDVLAMGALILTAESAMLLALAAHHELNLWFLIPVSFVGIAGTAITLPALQSIAAELTDASHVSTAIGWQRSAQSIGRIGGSAAGGIALSSAGIELAYLLQLFTILMCGVAFLVLRANSRHAKSSFTTTTTPWFPAIAQGFRIKWKIETERYWTLLAFAGNLFLIPITGLLLPAYVASNDFSPKWLAVSDIALGVGLLVAGLGGARLLGVRLGKGRAVIASLVSAGVLSVCIGMNLSPLVLPAAYFGIGFFACCVIVVGNAQRLLACPTQVRGTVASTNSMVAQIASTASSALAAILIANVGVGGAYLALGVCLALTGIAHALIPGFWALLSISPEAARDYYLKKHPTAFTPVPNRTTSVADKN